MTRSGTIASLPRQRRPKPDPRLANGRLVDAPARQPSSLPAIQFLLKTILGRRPIPSQNLSERKPGAFLDWQRSEDSRSPVPNLLNSAAGLDPFAGSRQSPSLLASALREAENAAGFAKFFKKPSSRTPLKVHQSHRIRPNPP